MDYILLSLFICETRKGQTIMTERSVLPGVKDGECIQEAQRGTGKCLG